MLRHEHEPPACSGSHKAPPRDFALAWSAARHKSAQPWR
jgi:hypothetical protein